MQKVRLGRELSGKGVPGAEGAEAETGYGTGRGFSSLAD